MTLLKESPRLASEEVVGFLGVLVSICLWLQALPSLPWLEDPDVSSDEVDEVVDLQEVVEVVHHLEADEVVDHPLADETVIHQGVSKVVGHPLADEAADHQEILV